MLFLIKPYPDEVTCDSLEELEENFPAPKKNVAQFIDRVS